MIGALRGSVVERLGSGESAVEVLLDVHGVGYRLSVTPRTAASLDLANGEVSLAVHTHVREGAITLYGFANSDERRAFELLLTAHGVGPALALAVLGVHKPQELAEAVVSGDVDALCLVPGVGKKTAARLLVDLKARFEQFDGGFGADVNARTSAGDERDGGPEDDDRRRQSRAAKADTAEALAQLGYAPDEIRGAIRELPDCESAEEMLRLALRELAPRR